MASRRQKSKPTSSLSFLDQFLAGLNSYRRETVGGVVLLLAVITLLSLLSLTEGSVSQWWSDIFLQLFGWGAIPATLILAVFGGLLVFSRLKNEEQWLPLDMVIGMELLFVVMLALTHLLTTDAENAFRLARDGMGGGFVGWAISALLADVLGPTPTMAILLVIGLGSLGLIFRLSLTDALKWAGLADGWTQHQLENIQTIHTETSPAEPVLASKSSGVRNLAGVEGQKKPKRAAPVPAGSEPDRERAELSSRTIQATVPVLPRGRYPLPPVDLLVPPAKDPTQSANARYQAQIIEETLQGFGVPTEVVEINRGPTVTQFGLKLGTLERKLPDGNVVPQRVRVNKVVALANDLALALSAAPIRIEAPVPGRPLVGIEVPNSEKTMVSLRAVIEDASFKNSRGALRVALGKGVSGQVFSAPLAEMPHLLIAGATGSGKSVCINTIISTLLLTHAPEQLRLLMVDPKMVELTAYNGIPHLLAPVVTDFEHAVGALAWITREMERRYKAFAAAGARSISSYNRKVGAKGDQLPYLVVIIDELADLMMMAPDEVERHVCRIAQMARATGIHLVIATQRPSVDVVTGLIKANFPTRIAFAVTSQIDSRVILDTPGAERLLGRGDMLYMAPDSPKLVRLQGCFVSDGEIRNLVGYWQQASGGQPGATIEPEQAEEEVPWAGMMAEADKDELLEEAVKLVIESDRASTSLLQRRLGIGYPRASRLMDQLEEEGVIGPAEGSKPREVLWRERSTEENYAEFEQDVAAPPASSAK